MSPLMPYTSVHALACPLVHPSVFLHTIELPVSIPARLDTANITFYHWDYSPLHLDSYHTLAKLLIKYLSELVFGLSFFSLSEF